MQVARPVSVTVCLVLVLDALLEFGGATGLLLARASLADWLARSEDAMVAVGVVFAAAGLIVAMIAAFPRIDLIRWLAVLNLAGGAAIWLVALLDWASFEPEGRWILAAAADTFIGLGAVEWVAIRRARR